MMDIDGPGRSHLAVSFGQGAVGHRIHQLGGLRVRQGLLNDLIRTWPHASRSSPRLD